MNRFKTIVHCLCICLVATAATLLLLDIRALVKAQFGVAQSEAQKTRDLADRHARQIEQDVRLRMDALVARADGRLKSIQADAKEQLSTAIADANTQLASANHQVKTVADTLVQLRTDLKPAIDNTAKAAEHAASVTAQVDEAAPLFLDCDFNPDCAFNRFQGTSKAVEKMAQAGAKAAPEISKSVVGIGKSADGIAQDVKKEADEITKPKKWYQKIFNPLFDALRVTAAFL